MELNIKNLQGKITDNSIKVSDRVFANDFNEPLIHQVVVAYLAGHRQGTKAQKTRIEVRGGGRKPWKQKGTGRARAGSIRSPLWRGGGVIFAAKPRDYSQKVNKKMYRVALRSIFSELIRQKRLDIVEKIELKTNKTKDLVNILKKLPLEKGVVVSDSVDQNLYLAARNIPNIEIRDVESIDPVSLLKFEKIIMTVEAMKQLEKRLA